MSSFYDWYLDIFKLRISRNRAQYQFEVFVSIVAEGTFCHMRRLWVRRFSKRSPLLHACMCTSVWPRWVSRNACICKVGSSYINTVWVWVQVYLWTGKWKFKVMDRKEVERQAVALRLTALDGNKGRPDSASLPTESQDAGTLHDLENGAHTWPTDTRCAWLRLELLASLLLVEGQA